MNDTIPNRHGSAVRTGRAETAENIREHHGMNSVTGGDPDVNIDDAYFTGEESPGGDNSTPDQDVVDDIGKALGKGWVQETDALGGLEDHSRDPLGFDGREIDADFVTMINVDYDIGHGRGDVRSGIEHRRDSHFLGGKGVVLIRINGDCQ